MKTVPFLERFFNARTETLFHEKYKHYESVFRKLGNDVSPRKRKIL